jgi:hypothetical protein
MHAPTTTAPAKRMRRQLRSIEAMFDDNLLGSCPGCRQPVAPDVHAFRYRSRWYHVRCALEDREPERFAAQSV